MYSFLEKFLVVSNMSKHSKCKHLQLAKGEPFETPLHMCNCPSYILRKLLKINLYYISYLKSRGGRK